MVWVTRPLLKLIEPANISGTVKYRHFIFDVQLPIFLRFGKFPPQIYESCGAIYQRNYETFSA